MAKKQADAANSMDIHGIAPYELKKNEEYMNDSQREHFKKILHAWKKS